MDMYTEVSIKENIVRKFSKEDGTLRIIIGTIAFGMCCDVRQIFIWGASHDIESYIQEKSGRDGYNMASAILFYSSGDI